MTKALFIVNPKAGGRKKADVLAAIAGCTHQWEIVETRYPGHATEIAASADADIVVAVGGDGTVNEVAKGLIGCENKAMGIIPCGSGDGLARHLKISRIPAWAVKTINKANIISIDTATLDGTPFFVTCGVGFDAEVSNRFASARTRGLKTYIEKILQTVIDYTPSKYKLILDGKEVEHNALLITVGNANQWGNNGKIAPRASLQDGLLEVTVIVPFPMILVPELVTALFLGNIDKSHFVYAYKAKDIKIIRDSEGPGHIDGDPVSPGKEISVSVNPASLRIVAP